VTPVIFRRSDAAESSSRRRQSPFPAVRAVTH
jgi:hypothetical protein